MIVSGETWCVRYSARFLGHIMKCSGTQKYITRFDQTSAYQACITFLRKVQSRGNLVLFFLL